MAFGKSPRMDGRRTSSGYCSTTTLVVFVALCLVGVWMMTSSTVVPEELASSENKSEMKDQASEVDSKPFEDSSGDVPEDSKRGEPNNNANTVLDETNSEAATEQEKISEIPAQKTKSESEDMSKTQGYSDANGTTEGGETNKEGGDTSSEGVQEKVKENNSDDTDSKKQEKNHEQNTEESTTNEQDKNPVQDPKDSGNDEQTSDGDKKPQQEEKSDTTQDEKGQGQIEEKVDTIQEKDVEQNSEEKKSDEEKKDQGSNEVFPDAAQSELLNETNTQNGAWSTQAAESKNEKEVQASSKGQTAGYSWKLCNASAGADYIPCLDNQAALKKLKSTKHYEHRERHCPEEPPTCLVSIPEGYKRPIEWPSSRDKIWYHNVPHTKLAVVKGHQNWVKVTGEYLTFPGGGTQFKHGALHYIDIIQEALPDIAWGKRSRVILDVGCGVASFGGFLFDRDVLTMSFAPKDEHEAQVQFALERGIPAISAVMGTKRLPFPGRVFDAVHCARCRVPWHIEGGKLLLELNRLLRPGGYFIWSATPVYQKLQEDVEIWEAMSVLTKAMCWELVTKTKDTLDQVGLAIYKKPTTNECYEKRSKSSPPLCQESDDPNAAWYIPLEACMHKLPVDPAARGSKWPELWPKRVAKTPYWLNSSQTGVYGKSAPQDFEADHAHWKNVVSKSYLKGMGINWKTVRNVMDMRAVYGGFAAALRDMKVWVMNVVSIDSPDTLPVIYERGLFGMYHDWCESFSSYPRTYDLLHADHLFSKLKKRCKLVAVMAEVDRILRPEGKLIVRDNVETINEIETMMRSLKWEIRMTFSKDKEGLLCVQKTIWRPKEVEEA